MATYEAPDHDFAGACFTLKTRGHVWRLADNRIGPLDVAAVEIANDNGPRGQANACAEALAVRCQQILHRSDKRRPRP